DELTRQTYLDIGCRPERVLACGHPLHDAVELLRADLENEGRDAIRARVLPDWPPGRPVFVFLSETSDGLNAAQFQRSSEYTLAGRGTSNERGKIVLEEVIDVASTMWPRPYLVLRLHPKQSREDVALYIPEVDAVSDGGAPLELVFVADLVVGMTTSLLLEAVILGRPTLSVLPRAVESRWLGGIDAGVIPAVTRREGLRSALALAVAGKLARGAPLDRAVRFGAIRDCVAFVNRVAGAAKP
ncbi:MAG: hypothetical protein K8F62_07170, partial [Pseudorhodoplanes sp.]|nr:hypothetical protein [Pseudorhodoplanes sp.]